MSSAVEAQGRGTDATTQNDTAAVNMVDSQREKSGNTHTNGRTKTMQNDKDGHGNDAPKVRAKNIGHYMLGRFKNGTVGKTIGEGTFGKVKVGTHILTGEKVAVKILQKEKIQDVSDVERVAREIHILKIMRHPHIIQLYEIIETPRQLYLIMEFASSGELFDYIVSHTRVKEKEGSRFFQQILSGVEYVHKLNVVHRDLKPENLLLDYQKNIKIVDFGLSNTYTPPDTLKTACGSPCYAAPEMIAGKRYKGQDVDIWSCGVILFAMLCGYLPFEDPNTAQLYKKILNANYKLPKFLSSDARDLIQSVLNTDPLKRYRPEDIKKHPWYLQTRPRQTEGIIVGVDQIPVDHDILSQLQQFGINLDYAQKCVEANKHNHVTTTYYLLLKRHIENGGSSVGDLFSDQFMMFQKSRTTELMLSMKGGGSLSQTGGLSGAGGTSSTTSGNSTNSSTQPEAAFAKTRKYLDSIASQMRAKKRAESTGGSSSRDREFSFTGVPSKQRETTNSYSPAHRPHPISNLIQHQGPNAQNAHRNPVYQTSPPHYTATGQAIPPGTAYSAHRPHHSNDFRQAITTSVPSTSVGRPRDKGNSPNNGSVRVPANQLFEERHLPDVKKNPPLIGFRDTLAEKQAANVVAAQREKPTSIQPHHAHNPSAQQGNSPPLLVLPNFVTAKHVKANSFGVSGTAAISGQQGQGNAVHSALRSMLQGMAAQSPGTAHAQARRPQFGQTVYNARIGTAAGRGNHEGIIAGSSISNKSPTNKPMNFPTRSPAFPQPLGNVVSRIKRLRPPSRGDTAISKPKAAYRPATRTTRNPAHDLNQTAPIGAHYLNNSMIEPSTAVNTSVLHHHNHDDTGNANFFKPAKAATGGGMGAPIIKQRQIGGNNWNYANQGGGTQPGSRYSPRPVSSLDQHYAAVLALNKRGNGGVRAHPQGESLYPNNRQDEAHRRIF